MSADVRMKIHFPERQHAAARERAATRISRLQPTKDHDDEATPIPSWAIAVPQADPSIPQPKPYDEEQFEHEVHDVPRDQDHERCSEIGDSAEVALPAEREKRRRETDRRDPQVGDGVVGGTRPRRPCSETSGSASTATSTDTAMPKASDSQTACAPSRPGRLLLPGTAGARDLRRRPVLEEVEDREEPAEDRERDAESGELRPSEMADDRRVDEQIERLGSESAQRGEREPHDLAVVRERRLTTGRHQVSPRPTNASDKLLLERKRPGSKGKRLVTTCYLALIRHRASHARAELASKEPHAPGVASIVASYAAT